MHATAYCPRHVDPLSSACLPCLSFNLCCVDKGPRQGVHAQAHPYTPTGKGRVVLRGAFLSTAHTGTGTGSEGGSDKAFEMVKVSVAVFGLMAAVSGSTAVAVHHLEQDKAATETKRMATETKRIEDKAAMEIARVEGEFKRIEDKAATETTRIEDKAATDIARVEGERRLSEEYWKAQVERYRYDLQLMHSQDYAPYQTAIVEKRKKRGGTGGLEKEEETD